MVSSLLLHSVNQLLFSVSNNSTYFEMLFCSLRRENSNQENLGMLNIADRERLARENVKTLRKIASSLKVSCNNVMRKVEVTTNNLRKQ